MLPQGEIDAVAETPPMVNAGMLSIYSVCTLPVMGNIDLFLKGAAAGTDNLEPPLFYCLKQPGKSSPR